jgi:hypothetical protein
MKFAFYFIVATIVFSSCARSFHPINPAIYNYDNKKIWNAGICSKQKICEKGT